MRFSIFIFFISLCLSSIAQMQLKVTVLDSLSKKPISNASINNNENIWLTNNKGQATISKFRIKNILITANNYNDKTIGQNQFVSEENLTVYLSTVNNISTAIEVTAIKASQKAPFASSTLDKKFIDKHNTGADLPFLLNQTPNLIAHSDAGNAIGYTGLRIRGSDASRINITINGVPFNDAESQGAFLVNIPDFISSAESIQIQRGVGTSTNGGAAFGASINLNSFALNQKPSVQINNSFGSFNTQKNTLKYSSGKLKEHFYFDARLSRIKSDGFIDRASSLLNAYYLSGNYVNNKTSVSLTTFGGGEKTYQAWYGIPEYLLQNNRQYNEAGTEKPGAPYENEVDNYKQQNYQITIRQKITNVLSAHITPFFVKGNGYYEQYKADVKYSKINLPNNGTITKTDIVRQLWLDNNFFGANYSLQYNKNNVNLIFGGSASQYNGLHFGKVIWALKGGVPNNHTFYNHKAHKKEFNNFLKANFNISNNINTYLDAQVRTVSYNINGFRNTPNVTVNNSYVFFNPKAGFQYQNKHTKIFMSIAKAAKEPNRDDFETGASQIPKPEKLTDLEIGYQNLFFKKLFFNVNAYLMAYNNQLVLTGAINDVGAQTRTNVAKSKRTGVELELNYLLSKNFTIKSNASFSSNKIKNFTESIPNYDNGTEQKINYKKTNIALSPSTLINFAPTLQVSNKVFIEWQNQYVGKQFLDNTSNNTRSLKAYYNSNLLINYTKVISKASATFFVQINNIFNKKYTPNGYTFNYVSAGALSVNNYYYPMAGTNFLIGANLNF
jgi:iron complex outermembrane recepter protein